MRTGFRFNASALAGRQAGLIFGLGWALVLSTLALAANAQNNQTLPASTPDKGSTDLPMPTPRPVDQAHVMADVGYHFANLWFAVENRNWPLAQYYLGETRSHLAWAVSIHPVRKTSAAAEVDLKGILDAVDNSFLSEVGKAIETKDTAKFKTAYQQTLEGCYACHTACEKPFLRLQIPTAPAATIINFLEPTNSPGLSSQAGEGSKDRFSKLDLNSDNLVIADEWRQFDTNSATAGRFAAPNQTLDAFMKQAPKQETRFQFLGGENPLDGLNPFGEVNPAPSQGWPLFSIRF